MQGLEEERRRLKKRLAEAVERVVREHGSSEPAACRLVGWIGLRSGMSVPMSGMRNCGRGCAAWPISAAGSATGGWRPCCDGRARQDADQRWSLDLVADALADGRRFRVLCVVDDLTREALATVVEAAISGARVVRELERLVGASSSIVPQRPAARRQRQLPPAPRLPGGQHLRGASPFESRGVRDPFTAPTLCSGLGGAAAPQYQSRRRRTGATHSRGGAAGSACSRWAMAVSGAFVNTPFTPLRNIVACTSGLALDRV